MTREEAIEVLENGGWWDSLIPVTTIEGRIEDDQLHEALDLALSALRPVSREQVEKVWRGEWKCHGDCGVTECPTCGWNIEEYVGDYNFCPSCGTPMTDEAVEMVMRRLEALYDKDV